MLQAGVGSLGDFWIENIERMRQSGIAGRIMLIRSPMLSQVKRVVASADLSVNTEIEVLLALSHAATIAGKTHEVLLMVELGDLREGIMPADLENMVQKDSRSAKHQIDWNWREPGLPQRDKPGRNQHGAVVSTGRSFGSQPSYQFTDGFWRQFQQSELGVQRRKGRAHQSFASG